MAAVHRRSIPLLLAVSLSASIALAETYQQPSSDVVSIVDASAPPAVVPSPAGDAMLLLDAETYPPIALLARPFLRLGGVRVDPATQARRRTARILGMRVQEMRPGSVARRVPLPEGATIGSVTWSFDGRRIAFTRNQAGGVEVWVCDPKTLDARPIAGVRVNDLIGTPLGWTRDNRNLLVRAVPADRGAAPAGSAVPTGPNVQETAGKKSRMATFRDLLADVHDEALFEHYATSQLLLVDVESGASRPLGAPGLYAGVWPSPDGEHWLVQRVVRPFSFRVPWEDFARAFEIWSAEGEPEAVLARLPVSDEVPQQGVRQGVRDPRWQPLHPATLVWVEALDGGDPRAQVPHRDRLVAFDVANASQSRFAGELAPHGRELLRLEERFTDIRWGARRDQALVDEQDRERRWTTTWLVDVGVAGGRPRKVFDRSVNDVYGDPGRPIGQVRATGEVTLRQDGDHIYLAGRGATPAGDRPFVDRMHLKSLAKEHLFQSSPQCLETPLDVLPGDRILTTYQSRTEPPNQFLVEWKTRRRTQLTEYRDPAPQLAGIEKRILKYRRADGTPLTAFLYLPPGYAAGTRLPTILWACPHEFSDGDTAGQVRGSENSFVRLTAPSHLFFLTQGYAVLDDPTIPVLGDPETMNNTYVEQIVSAARAAVDTLVAIGVTDPERVGIGGYSYGAFMAANLLAHSDLFAAGIARSGAYNRTLTPFGFQHERRAFWEAPELYVRMSPFTHADKIDEPILLVHGEEDTDSGTFPIQSERLFQALQGNGATARLVMLPYEGHGYRARESVLHTLAEMLAWADRWVKNRPAASVQQSRR